MWTAPTRWEWSRWTRVPCARSLCRKVSSERDRGGEGVVTVVTAQTHRWVDHTRLATAAACCCLPQSVKQDWDLLPWQSRQQVRHTNPQGGGCRGSGGQRQRGNNCAAAQLYGSASEKRVRFQQLQLGALTRRRGMRNCRSGDTWPRPGWVACAANLRQIYVASTHTEKQTTAKKIERKRQHTRRMSDIHCCSTRRSVLCFAPAAGANCAACWHLHLTSNNNNNKTHKTNNNKRKSKLNEIEIFALLPNLPSVAYRCLLIWFGYSVWQLLNDRWRGCRIIKSCSNIAYYCAEVGQRRRVKAKTTKTKKACCSILDFLWHFKLDLYLFRLVTQQKHVIEIYVLNIFNLFYIYKHHSYYILTLRIYMQKMPMETCLICILNKNKITGKFLLNFC